MRRSGTSRACSHWVATRRGTQLGEHGRQVLPRRPLAFEQARADVDRRREVDARATRRAASSSRSAGPPGPDSPRCVNSRSSRKRDRRVGVARRRRPPARRRPAPRTAPVVGRERQRDERRPRLDDARGRSVARGDTRSRSRRSSGSTGRRSRRRRAWRRWRRDRRSRSRNRSSSRSMAVDVDRPHPRDAARVAFGDEHRDDPLARVVAEQLAAVLLVPRDAMAVDERDEVARRVARERRRRERRIAGQEVRRADVPVREVAAAAARDADLLGELRGVVDQHDRAAAASGHGRAHHAGRAGPDDGDVEARGHRVGAPRLKSRAGRGSTSR